MGNQRGRKPPKTAPAKNGFNYKSKFGVIVLCDSEGHQRKVYDALRKSGHKCRVVCV